MTQSEIDEIEQILQYACGLVGNIDCSAARYVSDMIEGFTETFYPDEDEEE